MELQLDTLAFKSGLSKVAPFASKRNPNIRIKTEGDFLTLIGNDTVNRIAIALDLPTKGEKADFALPSGLLSAFVKKIPTPKFTIAVDREGEKVEVKVSFGRNYQKMFGLPEEDFFDFDNPLSGGKVSLTFGDFKKGIGAVIYAASSDSSRGILTGVYLKVEETLEFAAVDGYRMAKFVCENKATAEGFKAAGQELVFPAEILRFLAGKEIGTAFPDSEIVEISFDDARATFTLPGVEIQTRRLEGTYPAYRQLIPTDFVSVVECDRSQFLGALDLVTPMAEARSRVGLQFLESSLQLSANNGEIGTAIAEVDLAAGCNPMEITLNHKYLKDAVQNVKSDRLFICINAPTKPVVLRGGDDRSLALVMPTQPHRG